MWGGGGPVKVWFLALVGFFPGRSCTVGYQDPAAHAARQLYIDNMGVLLQSLVLVFNRGDSMARSRVRWLQLAALLL
jgi:hypothetical protein